MKLAFYGGAKMVTGSCYLLTTDTSSILIDCGMFQGNKEVEKLNYQPFDFKPSSIDFLLLTHGHIDHSGRIPKLVKDGFKGDIVSTKAVFDLCTIMLPDSAHIQQNEAEWKNRKLIRAGKDTVEPLYTIDDALESLRHFKPVLYNQVIEITSDISVRFKDAGHILGSAILEIWVKEGERVTKVVFSGDLGRKGRVLFNEPQIIEDCDYLVIESTYGDRIHEENSNSMAKLLDIINKTKLKGGNVIIPAFAVGRTQEIIYELNKYYDKFIRSEVEEFLNTKVYIDSPLAASATEIFRKNSDCFNEEAKAYILGGDNPLDFENLEIIRDVNKSKELNQDPEPKVIISSSGMCDAGRIKHHLKHNLWRSECSIVFAGYQAHGTLGRQIKDGAKKVKIFGEEIQVKASVYALEGFSGHGDKNDLIEWIGGFIKKPKKIFIVHGEEEAMENFQDTISSIYNIESYCPNVGDIYDIMGDNTILEAQNELWKVKEITNKIDELKYKIHTTLARVEDMSEVENAHNETLNVENLMLEIEKKIFDLNQTLNDISSKNKFTKK